MLSFAFFCLQKERLFFHDDLILGVVQSKPDQLIAGAICFSGKIIVEIDDGLVYANRKCNRFGELFNSEFIHYYHPNTIMR